MLREEEQFIVWQRYKNFQKMGMRESYVILFNGWLTMDYVLDGRRQESSYSLLTNDFLEQD